MRNCTFFLGTVTTVLLLNGAALAQLAPAHPPPAPAVPAPAAPAPRHRTTINNYNGILPVDRAYQEKQERAAAYYEAGLTALAAGKFAVAEDELRASILDEPRGERYMALAEALAAQGRTAQALESYNTVFHPPAHFGWGGSYMTRAHLEYAVLLARSGRWGEAVASYDLAMASIHVGDAPEIAVRFAPGDPKPTDLEAAAHLALGVDANGICNNLGEFENDRAFREYTQALRLAPDWAAANYYFGIGWQKLSPAERARFGTAERAKTALEKAVKLGKGDVKKAAEKALNDLKKPA